MNHFLGIISDENLEMVKDVAMNRYNVKASRRVHIKEILDDAFIQVMELNSPTKNALDLSDEPIDDWDAIVGNK